MCDCGFHGQAMFLIAATGISKLLVDHGDRQATGVIGLDRICDLKQFPLGGLGCRERAVLLESHLGCMIAMPMASAGCFSPLGPRGMSFPPDDDFGWFDDLYAVPPLGNPMMDAFSFSIQKILVAFSMFT